MIQLTCSRRERLVARVSSYGEEGFLYSAAGRVVHATLGDIVGEEAVVRMLGWHGGDFELCELPFPEQATIQRSTEGLLLLAAQRADDSALDALTALPLPPPEAFEGMHRDARTSPELGSTPRPVSRPSIPPPPPRTSQPPAQMHNALTSAGPRPGPIPTRDSRPSVPPMRASTPPPALPLERDRPSILPPAELPRSRSLPPPPPANARGPLLQDVPSNDPSLIASVRVDARGALLQSFGSGDHLAQLVAYIAHVVGLIQADFALDPFRALHADLAGLRVLIFQEAGDVVGMLMTPGSAAQELRARLGV